MSPRSRWASSASSHSWSSLALTCCTCSRSAAPDQCEKPRAFAPTLATTRAPVGNANHSHGLLFFAAITEALGYGARLYSHNHPFNVSTRAYTTVLGITLTRGHGLPHWHLPHPSRHHPHYRRAVQVYSACNQVHARRPQALAHAPAVALDPCVQSVRQSTPCSPQSSSFSTQCPRYCR